MERTWFDHLQPCRRRKAKMVRSPSPRRLGFLQLEDRINPTAAISVVASGLGITSGAGILRAGQLAVLTVNFDSSVTVSSTAAPSLKLNDGGVAAYAGGSGSSALKFNYIVASGENTPDLTVSAFSLNGSTIKDSASVSATLTGSVTNPAGNLQIDTTAPTVALTLPPTARQTTGTTALPYTVTFSEPVSGVDASGFTLATTGGASATISGVIQGSDAAHYTVTVATSNGGTVGLNITGAKIKDLAGNGLGGGSFSAAPGTPIAVGRRPYAVKIADFNGDGIADIATANISGSNVSVLLGASGGSFSDAPGSPFTVGALPLDLAVADFNADGKLDIAAINLNNENVSILLGFGNGVFFPASGSPFSVVGIAPYSVTVGDVDGDGFPDLVTANILSSSVSVLLGTGTGAFTSAIGSPITLVGSVDSAMLGDVNRDGKLDIVTSSDDANSVSVLLGVGNGQFGSASVISFAAGVKPKYAALADVDRDGNPDIVIVNSNDTVSVLLGTGTGAFGAPAEFAVGLTTGDLAVGDLNGDGNLDIVATGVSSASVLLGTGTGSFNAAVGSPFVVGSQPAGVAIGDINGDGRGDLVVAASGSSQVVVMLNGVVSQSGPVYDPPTIGSLSSTGVAGTQLDILGTRFSTTASLNSVMIGTFQATILSVATDGTKLSVTIPQGVGANLPLTVTSNNQPSDTVFFTFAAPTLVTVFPGVGPPIGGTSITLTGTMFDRTAAANNRVTVGDSPATNVQFAMNGAQVDFTRLIATVPAGTGANQRITVRSGSQDSNFLSFSYNAPTITSVSPTFAPTVGGTQITITGTNFSANSVLDSVLIGDWPASVVNVNAAGTSIVVSTPVGSGFGQTIQVTVGTQFVVGPAVFNYAAPTFLGIRGNHGPTSGGTTFTIAGTNFGPTSTQLDFATVSGDSATITSIINNIVATFDLSGHIPNYSFTGSPSSTITYSEMVLVSPAGTGMNRPIVVRINQQAMPAAPLLQFSYDAPILLGVLNNHGPTVGGSQVTVAAQNLGTTQTLLTATIGTTAALVLSLTNNIVGTFDTNGSLTGSLAAFGLHGTAGSKITFAQVVLSAPVGTGFNKSISLSTDGQPSVTSAAALFSYDAPILLGVMNNRGPTTGGTSVTIAAQNLGTNQGLITALISTAAAAVLSLTNNVVGTFNASGSLTGTLAGFGLQGTANSTITFAQLVLSAPAGSGAGKTITVNVDGLPGSNAAVAAFHYDAPILLGVINNHGPTSGGTSVTVAAQNLGTNQSLLSAMINSNPASVVSLVANVVGTFDASGSLTGTLAGFGLQGTPTSKITFAQLVLSAPAGSGSSRSISVTADGQPSVPTSLATFSYDAPILLGVMNNHGPTTGGSSVTIAAQNLGPSQAFITASIGTAVASVLSLANNIVGTFDSNGNLPGTLAGFGLHGTANTTITFAQLVLSAPAGTGINKTITLNVDGLFGSNAAVASFSYDAPLLLGVINNHGPTAGGTQVTIAAQNLGTNQSLLSGMIGSTPATVVSLVATVVGTFDSSGSLAGSLAAFGLQGAPASKITFSQVVLSAPVGTGSTKSISVSTDGQASIPASFATFNYDAPILLGTLNNHGSTNGGTAVTIAALNLGTNNGLIAATIGTAAAPVLSLTNNFVGTFDTNGNLTGSLAGFGLHGTANSTITFAQLVLSAPAGTGTNKTITLNVDNQFGSNAAVAAFSYDPPIFLAIKNNHGSTNGGTPVTIAGSNFGNATNLASVLVGGVQATVASIVNNLTATFDSNGILPGYGISGPKNSTITFSEFTFATPAGVGVNKSIGVTIDGQLLSTSAKFNYDPPQILSISPNTGTSLGGTQVTILGNNFGPSPTVTIGSQGVNFVSLTDIMVNSVPVQQLVVTTLPGGGSNLQVAISVGTQSNIPGATSLFSYVPTITSNGGGVTSAVSVAENVPAVTTVTAAAGGIPLLYSIAGGVDAAKFQINAATGLLSFVAPPDFESPTDAGGDNFYNVTVQASDGITPNTQSIAVTVTNVTSSNQDTYVNSAWASLTTGTAIADADPVALGNQSATIGVNAFATIPGGAEAVGNNSAIDVLAGSYPQSASFSQMLRISVPTGHAATISGNVTFAGGLILSGAGTLTLSGADSDSGVTVATGTLRVDGSRGGSGNTFVSPSGTLAGTGTMSGAVTATGILAPGGAVGTVGTLAAGPLTIGSTSLGAGTLSLDLLSKTSYDAVKVPSLNLIAATLSLNIAAGLASGDQFTIVSVANTGAVTGAFDGLPEGGTFPVGSRTFRINYAAGDGNDVVLTDVTPVSLVGIPALNANPHNDPRYAYIAHGNQHSMVESVAYSFSGPVSLTRSDFAISNKGAANIGGFSFPAYVPDLAVTGSDNNTLWTVTFANHVVGGVEQPDGVNDSTGSIGDGKYELALNNAANILTSTYDFYRLLGDVNHKGIVDGDNFQALITSLNQDPGTALYVGAFDFDGGYLNPTVNGADFQTLVTNFNHSVLPIDGFN